MFHAFSRLDSRPIVAPCLVAGYGSFFGDDQLGWYTVNSLQGIVGPSPSVYCMVCDRSGVEWITHSAHFDRLILVDAVVGAGALGSVHSWHLSAGDLPEHSHEPHRQTHLVDPLQAWLMAVAMGKFPPDAWLVGMDIQPDFNLHNDTLSTLVLDQVPLLIERIIELLVRE